MFRPESHWEDVINRREAGQKKKRLRKLENHIILEMDTPPGQQKFPFKLFNIVNGCKTNAITWGNDGKSIIIDYSLFQQQYLDCRAFKTANLTSFIRQLNLYGFHKISSPRRALSPIGYNTAFLHEYQNMYFLRGHPELLKNIDRKVSTPASTSKMNYKSPGPKRFTAYKKSQNPKKHHVEQYSILQKALDNAAVKREKIPEYDKETQTGLDNSESLEETVYVHDSEVLTELVTDEFHPTDWASNFVWAETHESDSMAIDSKAESLLEESDESNVITELIVSPVRTNIEKNNPPSDCGDHTDNTATFNLVQVEKECPVFGFWGRRSDYASSGDRHHNLGESSNKAATTQVIGFPSGQWTVKE